MSNVMKLAVALTVFGGAAYGDIDQRCPRAFTYEQLQEMANHQIITVGRSEFWASDSVRLKEILPKAFRVISKHYLYKWTEQTHANRYDGRNFECNYIFQNLTAGITGNEYYYSVQGLEKSK